MPNTPPRLVANGNISPSRFVKMDSTDNHRGLQCGANELPIGISYEGSNVAPLSDLVSTNYHAQVNQPISLYGAGEECLLELGDSVSAGDRLKSDSSGRGVAIASTGTTRQYSGARALEAGTIGQKIRVQVEFLVDRPALQ